MAVYNIGITDAGADLITKQIIAGTAPVTFTEIAIGDGELAEDADVTKISALVSEKKRLPVETFTRIGNKLWITARLATDTITEPIYHREVGVYAGGILFAYGNAGNEYDFIPPAGENAAVSKIIRMTLAVGAAKVIYEELDTTDLVTYEALENRVETIVKPVAREVLEEVADNVAPEAVNRAVDKYMNEAVGLLVNRRVNEELYTAGEYRTLPGADNYMGYAFDIFDPPLGDMSQIALPCRSKAGTMYTDLPVYLAIFEYTAAGAWVHIGTSTNAVTQTVATTAYFNFDGLHLSGRKIRIMIKTSREDTEPVAHYSIGARVTPAPEKGIAWTNEALTESMEYVLDVTFTGANVAEKYAPLSHVGDETHVNDEEATAATGWLLIRSHPGAGGTHLFTIGDKPIAVPDTSNLNEFETVGAKYVETINAAQPYVTATYEETPAELGGDGYFFTFTANTPGAIGNGIKLELGSTPEGQAQLLSGDTLSGGKDAVFPHMANAACHVSEYDRAKWDTPLNAYQLFMEQPITAIPEAVDLTKTLFAYQMCWNCNQLTSIAGLQMPSAVNVYGAFYGCAKLADISGSGFSLASNTSYMFAGCTSLQTIGNAVFEYAEICNNMFDSCSSLKNTGTATFNSLRRARYMFAGCPSLEDITSMNFEPLIDAYGMFNKCILNLASVKHIANLINTVAGSTITIGINAELEGNSELATAIETIRSKGWTVIEEYNTKTA